MRRVFLAFNLVLLVGIAHAQQRVVLLEQFSNSGCPPCAAATPPVLNHVEMNPATTMAITYHTSFPYRDSMYFENPVDANARTSYYSVGGVPYSVIDGNYYRSSSSALVPQVASQFAGRSQTASSYQIDVLRADVVNGTLTARLRFTSLLAANASNPQTAHIVVVEQTVLKSSYLASPGSNSENEYKYVMRKMLPTASGTVLTNRGLQGVDEVEVTWPLRAIKRVSEIRIVGFVQNETDKSIQQAVMMSPNLTLTSTKPTTSVALTVYPNPTSNHFSVTGTGLEEGSPIALVNSLGRQVWQGTYTQGKSYPIEHVPAGLYFLQLPIKAGAAKARLLVTK